MRDEEKVVEFLNKIYFLLDDVYSTGLLENKERNEYQQSLGIAVSLIEEQQKENTRLKEDNYRLDRENQLKLEKAVDTSDYIPKEAIREKLEELENDKSYYKNGYYDTGAKMILKELLEE